MLFSEDIHGPGTSYLVIIDIPCKSRFRCPSCVLKMDSANLKIKAYTVIVNNL